MISSKSLICDLLLYGEADGIFVVTGHHGSNSPFISFLFQVFDAQQTLEQSFFIHCCCCFVSRINWVFVA